MKTLFLWSLFTSNLLLPGIFSNSQPAPVSFKVDIAKSKMRWTGYYLFNFGEHNGSIQLSKGEVRVDDDLITGGFDIDMASIKDLDMPPSDGGKDLEEHLKGNDFFATDKFPTARFEILKSEKIKDANAGEPNYDITGDLTIKGTKNTLSFPATITFNENEIQAKAKFKFDRTKWNIQYNSGKVFSDVGDGAISDAIAIELDLIGVK